MNNRYAIIMAGGIGSRFWPLSRKDKPKQFLDILGQGESLIQQTFRRIKSVCNQENIIIVTNFEYKNLVIDQLGVRPERVLVEPFRRNTAPCIAYGTYTIMNENPEAAVIVTPADHIILNEEEFSETINIGFRFAFENEALITLGIIPDKPETGYGYIQAKRSSVTFHETGKFMKVKSFIEKPDIDLAKKLMDSGDFYWNSGIFIWSVESIVKALDKFLPDISHSFSEGKSFLGTDKEHEFINKVYCSIRNISIDFGVLEKADNIYVLSTDMGWSDLGTWSSLYSHITHDVNSNAIVLGKAHTYDSNRNLISIKPGKTAILEGLNDFIIVDTDNALLVIRKEKEQSIKMYLEDIKN